jgi:endoplasmic reticulum junction formation protein lunapark
MVHLDRRHRRCVRKLFNLFTQTHVLKLSEKTLVTLRKQQREKIEEIKKKTNYYTTRNLLDRYDESVSRPGTPQRRQVPPQTPVQPQPNQKQGPAKPQSVPTPLTSQVPFARAFSDQRSFVREVNKPLAMPVTPQPPPRKQWYDKLADAILGDDDATWSPSSRYALICQKCFAHNGLVKESAWQDAREPNLVTFVSRFKTDDCPEEYVCPKCGHFNPSARSIQQGISSASPSPISAANSRGLNGVNGFPHSPLNQPTSLPQSQLKLTPESAKVRPRKSFKNREDGDDVVEVTTVDMDVDNDSS